jgi:hypothetical protein
MVWYREQNIEHVKQSGSHFSPSLLVISVHRRRRWWICHSGGGPRAQLPGDPKSLSPKSRAATQRANSANSEQRQVGHRRLSWTKDLMFWWQGRTWGGAEGAVAPGPKKHRAPSHWTLALFLLKLSILYTNIAKSDALSTSFV